MGHSSINSSSCIDIIQQAKANAALEQAVLAKEKATQSSAPVTIIVSTQAIATKNTSAYLIQSSATTRLGLKNLERFGME